MEVVFTLDHVYSLSDGRDEIKRIGIYTSFDKAGAAIKRLRTQAGFIDHPDGFLINEVKLDRDGWTEGFIQV
jgi:hypothetical protein